MLVIARVRKPQSQGASSHFPGMWAQPGPAVAGKGARVVFPRQNTPTDSNGPPTILDTTPDDQPHPSLTQQATWWLLLSNLDLGSLGLHSLKT